MPRFSLDEVIHITGAKAWNARDVTFEDVTTDTRKISPGALFIALRGERFNGEDFVRDAVNGGAAGVLVGEDCADENIAGITAPLMKVADTLAAYQKIARAWRGKFDIPVVAVTGSNGKTTTKDLIHSVLSARHPTLRTEKNFNNEIGLPLTLLRLSDEHHAAVVEIGMRGLGQIAALAPVAAPTIGVVTNVGETHIELLGSIENIARAKGELVEAIPKGGTVILNADDANVVMMRPKAKPGARVITFGEDMSADVRVSDISWDGTKLSFGVSFCGGAPVSFALPLAGRHNVQNALAALAVGWTLGFSADEMRRGLSAPQMSGSRLEQKRIGQYLVINDAYNASPLSMAAALMATAEIAAGRWVAVLGDMLELGDFARDAHRRAGEKVASLGAAALVTRGELGGEIASGAESAGMTEVYRASSHEEAGEILKKILRPGDTILFKGSHGMHMDEIIDSMWTGDL